VTHHQHVRVLAGESRRQRAQDGALVARDALAVDPERAAILSVLVAQEAALRDLRERLD